MTIRRRWVLGLVLLLCMQGLAIAQNATCTVTGTIYLQDNITPNPAGVVVVNSVTLNGALISLGAVSYPANSFGQVSIVLPQGSVACISGNIQGYRGPGGTCVKIPFASSATLTSLPPASSQGAATGPGPEVLNNGALVTITPSQLNFSSQFAVVESPAGDDNIQVNALSRAVVSDLWNAPFWANIPDKPSAFPPSAHTHAESDVTGLINDLNARLPLSGGTLTGPLVLAADPTAPLGAATKEYVDRHGAGASFVQGAARHDLSGTLSTISLAFSVNNTSGDTLVVAVAIDATSGQTITSVTDSQGNTYASAAAAQSTSHPYLMQVFIVPRCAGGANTVTLTASGVSPELYLAIHEYSFGGGVSPVVDSAAFDSGTAGGAGTLTSGSVTASAPNDLLFAFAVLGGTGLAGSGSGFVQRENPIPDNSVTEDTTLPTSGPATATVANSASGSWGLWAVALAIAPASEPANEFYAGPGSGSAAQPAFRLIVPSDLPVFGVSGSSHSIGAVPDPGSSAGSTRFLREDGTWAVPSGGGGGGGSVTSVALSLPAIFSVAGSPITSSGTFTVTLATESANTVWAGPSSGSAAAPTFRGLVFADLPSGGTYTLGSGLTITGAPVTYGAAVIVTPVTLTDGATISTNAALSTRFRVTLGGNRTLANPSNPADGEQCVWEVIQDGTGSRTLTLGSAFEFGNDVVALNLSTAAGAHDFVTATYNAGTSKWYVVGVQHGY